MWPNPQFPADLVTFAEEISIGKLPFLCIENPVLQASTISINLNKLASKQKEEYKIFRIFNGKMITEYIGKLNAINSR